MSDSSAERNPVEVLAEQFLERGRRGERPSLTEYLARYPELADQIRELFPLLLDIEEARPPGGNLTGPFAPAASAGSETVPRQVGDFRVLREIGRGGMGVVYEAEQVSLGRHVALKVLARGMLDPKQVRRFDREARAAGRLHHSNIVPVHGVGEHDGLHYYVMQFIPGQPLDEVLGELRRLQAGGRRPAVVPQSGFPASADPGRLARPDRSAAAVARSLMTGAFDPARDDPGEPGASATTGKQPPVADAPGSPGSHSSLALPGSTEVSGQSRSGRKPTYWQSVAGIGLQVAEALEYAHRQGVLHRDVKPSNLLLDPRGTVWVTDFGLAKADDSEDLTHTGDIIGTLRYMPPEAFEGQADARADVYALGLTLYELLALRPAFTEKDRHQLIRQVTETEPPRLGKLNPAVPHDLQTIVHKAIEKAPGHRYATAGALAADLQRYLDDRPIQARRVSARERLWRWCRRNPAVASLAAAVVLVFLAGFAGVTWKWQEAERQKDIAAEQQKRAEGEAEKSRRLLYTSDLNMAHQLWETGNLARARELLDRQRPQPGQDDLRGFERRYLRRLCQDGSLHTFPGHTWGQFAAVAFSPDGTLLASASPDRSVQLWDVVTRRDVGALRGHTAGVTSLAFSGDGKRLATAGSDAIRLWDVALQREVGRWPGGTSANGLALAPDGTRLASIDGKGITLWDVATRQAVGTLLGHADRVTCVAFAPDGRTLASGSADGMVRLWDMATQREIAKLEGHKTLIGPLVFSPDGRRLASASPDAGVQLWDTGTRQVAATLRDFPVPIYSMAFSPDSKMLATGIGGGTVKLWDAATKEMVASLRGHTVGVRAVAFAPDGRTLATASGDQTVKLWQVTTRQDPNILTGYKAEVRSVAFSPDGKTLAVGDHRDQTVKLWDVALRQPVATLRGHQGVVWTATFAPDGQTLASTSNDRTVRLWNVATRQQVAEFGHPNGVQSAAFAPDGKLLAACTWNDVWVWDVAAGRKVTQLRGGAWVQFSPDGTRLASGVAGGTVQLWDVATWQPVATLTGHTAGIRGLAFSADGKLLATASDDYTVRLWDVATGREIAVLKGHSHRVIAVAISPDGKTLASGGDNTVKLWNLILQEEVAMLRGHSAPVTCLAFSPDGNLLASGSGDGTVRLWPAASFQETDAPEVPVEMR